MSDEKAELVRQWREAWSRGDLDGFLSYFDPGCEVVFSPDVPEPGPFHGRDELRGWAEGFRSAWGTHRAELEELEVAGDDVYALLKTISRGAGSGIEQVQTFPFVLTIKHGSITRWRGFATADEARAAAGLPM